MEQQAIELTDTVIVQVDPEMTWEDYLKMTEELSRQRILAHFGKINDVQLTRLGYTIFDKPFRHRYIIEYYWYVK